MTVAQMGEVRFIQELVATDDVPIVDAIARRGAVSWAVLRGVTLIACWRMKKLFESASTRREAERLTGYTSWSAWVDDIGLPISASLIRTRAMDIEDYVRIGTEWDTILNILAYAPTAGHEVRTRLTTGNGDLLSHIDESSLPGGSVAGLLEAIASAPGPGHARQMVSDAMGDVRIYPTRVVYASGTMYAEFVYEMPRMDMRFNVVFTARQESGNRIPLPEPVAHWLADRLGVTVEIVA